MKKIPARIILLASALLFVVSLSVQGAPLFTEDWSSGSINTTDWAVAGDDGASHAARVIDVDGNPAFLMGNAGLDWTVKLRGQQGFTRGNNLRVTFRMWGEPNPGDLTPPFDFVQVFPGASGLMAPWHNTADIAGAIYATIDAGIDQWHNINRHTENGHVQNGPYLKLPLMDETPGEHLVGDFADALSRGTSILISVWVGNTSGCVIRHSNNGGVSFINQIDTRGEATYRNQADDADLPTGTATTLYLGFGPAQGGIYIDDIVVEDDLNQIPVELSDFAVE